MVTNQPIQLPKYTHHTSRINLRQGLAAHGMVGFSLQVGTYIRLLTNWLKLEKASMRTYSCQFVNEIV